MSWREKYLFNGTTICIVPAVEKREPVLLCDGKMCEIQQYIGVHCNPKASSNVCWQYCLIVEATETTTTYKKLQLEKDNNVLVFKLACCDSSILEKLIDVCFSRRTKRLIDIRSEVMLETGMFIYDSMRRLMQGIHHFDCSSYRLILVEDYASFR
jgi:hypothetical protein